MGNLNDNTLPIVKRIMGISGTTEDTALLNFIAGAVPMADLTLNMGMSVTIADSSYVLSPDPADTDGLWAVLALGSIYLYRQDAFSDELADLNGLTTISDQIQSFSRAENIRALREGVDYARKEFQQSLTRYSRFGSLVTSYSYEEIETREDTVETVLGIDI